MDINAEVYAFLTMVYCGIVMGILFSVYCEKRRLFKRGPIMGPIEDILFWIVQAGVLFLFLYWSNYGEIRMFSILGAAVGFTVYYHTLRWLVVRILDFAFTTIIKAFSFISATLRRVRHTIKGAAKKITSIKFFCKNKRN